MQLVIRIPPPGSDATPAEATRRLPDIRAKARRDVAIAPAATNRPMPLARLVPALAALLLAVGCSPDRDELRIPDLGGLDPRTAPEPPAPEDFVFDARRYAPDLILGLRPRRSVSVPSGAVSLATAEQRRWTELHDAWGFVAAERRVPTEGAGAPRVLLVGDEQLDGPVAPADHAATRIRERLRAAPRFAEAEVACAACVDDSLARSLLRTHAFAGAFSPDLVVVCVSLADDLLQIRDPAHPDVHEDGAIGPATAPVTASSSHAHAVRVASSLGLPPRDAGLALYGLAQAAALVEPGANDAIRTRASSVLDAWERLAAHHGFALLFVTIPGYDLVFPDKVATALPAARPLIESGAQERARSWLLDELARRKVHVVALRDEFRWAGPIDLYTADFRIHVSGHRRLAEAALPAIRDLLDQRRR
jgi:hypothetical protein